MTIYVVQQGDTTSSIAEKFEVPEERLCIDNGLAAYDSLVPGQTIVIAYPKQTYIVQEGDTLLSISENYGISMIQLIRNNPFLSNRKNIFPGETLVISYDNNKGKITTNGFVNPFISEESLKKSLPFLSYLTVFGYRTIDNASISEVDDSDIIRLAKLYKVAPVMFLSTMTSQGNGNIETAYKIIFNERLLMDHIRNSLSILQRKGFYGANYTFQFINVESLEEYEEYTKKLVRMMKRYGFHLFVTLSENFIVKDDQIVFDKIDISRIGKMADGVTLLNFNWGYYFGPPGPIVSVLLMRKYLDYVVKKVPPGEIEVCIPILGYDWELPYMIGVTKAKALTIDSAVTLAGIVGATIQFDETSKSPYFTYTNYDGGVPRRHIVWFVDTRTVDAMMQIVMEYGLRGIGLWNIMNYCPQTWLVINSQYQIETLLH